MSVGTRRLAAAQRTAVGTSPSRAKRLGAWIIIVPALSLFSFSIVAGAAGFQNKPDLVAAATKVVPKAPGQSPGSSEAKTKPEGKDGGSLVVVDASKSEGGIATWLGKSGPREICWISRSQLVRVSAVYRTSTSSLSVGGKTYSLVTVFGASEKGLQQALDSSVQCKLVQVARLFFLPFDGNLS